ncbi:MAG: hypothetical protein ABMA25_07860 [Ilumatobacteraceae bacterium]
MTGPRPAVVARRFAGAFGFVALATLGAVWLNHDSNRNDSSADTSTSAPEATSATSAPGGPTAPGSSDTTAAVGLAALPVPDLLAFCTRHFGADSLVISYQGDVSDQRCSSAASSQPAQSIDVSEQCRLQFGDAAQPVRTDDRTTPWRCTADDAIDLGPPEYEAICDHRWGEAAVATQLADDVDGWRCAVVQNGVFALESFAPDDACQATYGTESYSRPTSKASDGLRCYGRSQ